MSQADRQPRAFEFRPEVRAVAFLVFVSLGAGPLFASPMSPPQRKSGDITWTGKKAAGFVLRRALSAEAGPLIRTLATDVRTLGKGPGFEVGELMPDGRIAGEGPGAALKDLLTEEELAEYRMLQAKYPEYMADLEAEGRPLSPGEVRQRGHRFAARGTIGTRSLSVEIRTRLKAS